MKYLVKRILEPDYGCEERPADYIAMDTVVLNSEEGKQLTIQVADEELYAKDINEGDWVSFDAHDELFKKD